MNQIPPHHFISLPSAPVLPSAVPLALALAHASASVHSTSSSTILRVTFHAHISNFVSLSVMKRAKRAAFISEHARSFTAAMRDGAVNTALDLGLTIVANVGIKVCTGAGCPTTKPARDALTKLIPAGGKAQHRV